MPAADHYQVVNMWQCSHFVVIFGGYAVTVLVLMCANMLIVSAFTGNTLLIVIMSFIALAPEITLLATLMLATVFIILRLPAASAAFVAHSPI